MQPQVYETPAMVAEARRLSGDHAHWGTPPLASARRELVESWDRALQSQAYTDTTSTFVPISIADAANATAPIRITIVWEVVDRGDAVFIDPSTNALSTMPRQCSTVGQVISVRSTAGWRSYTEGCKAANVVGGVVGDATLAQMKLRTATAKAYWQATLKVKPVQDKIKVSTAANNAITGDFGISAGREFLDSDLVIIMTARPSPDSPIAGFAICYQKDQRGRCTIGQFNWVPEIINPSKGLSADTIEAEMHTALHEMVHVLGGMSPGSNGDASVFLGPTGAPMQGSDVFITEEDPAFSEAIAVAQSQGRVAAKKYRTMIATPKVRATARKWLGCNNISGFPLEDVPLGKGSHWEARVGGPELMSYGAGSGQTYISDLTLGFLDDTNQYVVNYAMGGQLPGVMTTDESAALFSAQAGSQLEPASSLSPGALRWGQFEGCGFINSPPRVSWPEEYLCQTKNTYTCTPDHRMSAVCMMSTWTTVPSNPSCGRFVQYNSTFQPPATGPLCEVTNDSPVLNGIPSYMQFYPDDAAAATAMGAGATAARSGGINDAMDFAPVPVGYWNCMYATPSDNSTTSSASEYGALKSIVESFGKAADMNEFGGQARSPQSRCFVSSLMELTRVATLNPTFPKYGLCYRANCYKKDYLQVGVLSAVRRTAQWYQCPAAGGKLYIPGFTGSLHCPVAEDFCSHETITGFKYAEVSIIAQAIFWGLALAALLFFFGFALLPCMRERVITCSKRCCAVRVLEDDVAKRLRALGKGTFEAEALEMELGEPAPLPVTATRILLSINLITLLLGLAITGFTIYMLVLAKVYSFSFSLLGVGFMISMVSVLGVQAARSRAEHQPSCWVLTYFVCDLGVSILLLWTVAYNLAFPSYKYYVTEYWDVISSALPASLTAGLNQTAAIDVVTAKLTSNFTAISGMGAAVLVLLLITLAAAGVIITAKVLNTISLTIMNYALLIGGVVMTAGELPPQLTPCAPARPPTHLSPISPPQSAGSCTPTTRTSRARPR